GMGEVLVARDDQIGREVAIKRMKQREPSARAVARFLREAKIQARLEHPAIVPVHEIGIDEAGLPFFAMKKLTGTTLESIIEDAPESEYGQQRLLGAFVDVCLAIEFAHTRGVIHRDIKPANIMLGDFGEVYVLDWGVAKVGAESDIEEVDATSSGDPIATAVGTQIGTRGYMSPEQLVGAADLDFRTDIYALGCVLFEILTRTPLQQTKDQSSLPYARASARAPERDIPPELDALCLAATAVDRDRRPSARALGDQIQAFLDGDRDIAQRRALANDHLARARAAFTPAAGEQDYGAAMREAGRALVLDPTSREAGELIAKMMIQPPQVTPAAVDEALRIDNDHQFRAFGRITIVSALAYVPFIPMWISMMPTLNAGLLIAALLVNLVIAWTHARGYQAPGAVVVLARVSIVAAFAWTFSPLFLAPALAAAFGMVLALDPRLTQIKSAIGVAVALSLAVIAPAIAEHFGVLPATAKVTAEGVTFFAPGLDQLSLWYAGAFSIALTCTAVYIAFALARSVRTARRQLQVQAWQLRQLVAE
nr:serine/threonine protein kinase [Deltaproteobacteria bacterium]